MDCARAECPASRGTIRFVQKRNRFVRASSPGFETMIPAVDSGLPEAQCFRKKALGLLNFTDREHRTVKSVHRLALGDFRSGPALAPVRAVFDDFESQPRGMPESYERLPEPFGDRVLVNFVALEMLSPER